MSGGSFAEIKTEMLEAILNGLKKTPSGAGEDKDRKFTAQLEKELQSREGNIGALEIAKSIISGAMKAGESVESFNRAVQKSLGDLLARPK